MRDGPTSPPHRAGKPSFSGRIRKSQGSAAANRVSPLPVSVFPAVLRTATETVRMACNCQTDSCSVLRCFDSCHPGFHLGGGVCEGPGDGRTTCCHAYSFFSVFAGNSGAAWRTEPAHTRGQSSLKPRSPELCRLSGAPAAFRKPFSNSSQTQPAFSQDDAPGRNTMLSPLEQSGAASPRPPYTPAIPPPFAGRPSTLNPLPNSRLVCISIHLTFFGGQVTLRLWGLDLQLRFCI